MDAEAGLPVDPENAALCGQALEQFAGVRGSDWRSVIRYRTA
jgi:hypothetical protein